MRASELEAFSTNRTQLRRYVETGALLSLGSGFYAHPTLDPFVASVLAVAKYYPNAVISNRTALVIHGLSDERLDQIDVDIPRKSSIRNRLIRAHRVPERTITGVTQSEFHGRRISMYSLERSLCDAYRIDPDGYIFFKALKRYVQIGNPKAKEIAELDKVLSTNVLRALIQEIADE